MRKSEQYKAAMLAVLDHELIQPAPKLEILETLMADRRLALFAEEPKVSNEDKEAATE